MKPFKDSYVFVVLLVSILITGSASATQQGATESADNSRIIETTDTTQAKLDSGNPKKRSGFLTGGIFGRKQKENANEAASATTVIANSASTEGIGEKISKLPSIDKRDAAEKRKAAKLAPQAVVNINPERVPLGLWVGTVNYDIWVSRVTKGSAADKAGIRTGDRIISFGSMTYANSGMSAVRTINNLKEGSLLVNWDSPNDLEPKAATLNWGSNN